MRALRARQRPRVFPLDFDLHGGRQLGKWGIWSYLAKKCAVKGAGLQQNRRAASSRRSHFKKRFGFCVGKEFTTFTASREICELIAPSTMHRFDGARFQEGIVMALHTANLGLPTRQSTETRRETEAGTRYLPAAVPARTSCEPEPCSTPPMQPGERWSCLDPYSAADHLINRVNTHWPVLSAMAC